MTPSGSLPTLSLAQARCLHLAAQGLLHPPRRRARTTDVTAAIARMCMLQIDSIHVVARSPYMVLFSRLGAYPQAWLDEALAAGHIAECWAHEACFVPTVDYPWHRAAQSLRTRHWAHRHARRMQHEQAGVLRALLEQVRSSGPVLARDLAGERPRGSGWWTWSTEKAGLEALFARGELMVSRRDRFQRVYDVSRRVLERMQMATGADIDSCPAPERVRERFTADAVRALGVADPRWIGDYHRQGTVDDDVLQALVGRGELLWTRIAGRDMPVLVHRDHAALARRVAEGRLRATHSTLLSPFDPVIWDRTRARELFGFDYALECYTPAHKRRYGYYVLPWLYRGRLLGRIDAKAHRREGVFEVRALHMEREKLPSAAALHGLARALEECARWHGTPEVVLGSAAQPAMASALYGVFESGKT